ncbi:phosphotransferase family protein [Streptomyces purpurogeneiscleroticus]|uniref:phosphotransferase family protein n=1 Tax=Streptomyces purpurogeneiscleroticus TaxID=68259 RepID=UPI001CBEA978|nr:phosphotransferase family protein [Streptomyces purpurogeneiscleroticus]MBZ4018975.1 aminoglycoside phosphotransferase [Streptomyces purpurogeneiscleroticus]
MSAALSRQLAARLTAVLGTRVTIDGLHRLTGGASRETWAFTAVPAAGEPRRLILRRDPPGAGRPEGMAREAAAIGAAARAGVPVPPLLDSGTDPATVGAPYLITAHVDGETIARRLLREHEYAEAREGMAAELGRALARIHAIDVGTVPGLESFDPLERLRESCDALGEPLPAVEIALRWLAGHRPGAVPEAVVHGDFRTGNLIIDPGGLRAVLDWEVVHRGDPREDLGWLCVKCWRFGSALPAGGFGTVAQLLDGYAEVAGHRPDPEAVRWWQIYGTARWAVGCRTMAWWHLSGETRSVELAAVGRRVCEQEHDLLLALGIPPDPDDSGAVGGRTPWADLHGRPSAPELVAAVAEFLREEVMPATDGRTGFLARVAANVLDGVERELWLGPDQARRHRDRLDALALRDRAALAAAIRSGVLDASDPALLAAVRAEVTDRLAVANPRYA